MLPIVETKLAEEDKALYNSMQWRRAIIEAVRARTGEELPVIAVVLGLSESPEEQLRDRHGRHGRRRAHEGRPMTVFEKIEAAKEPQHVAASCPECGPDAGAGSPAALDPVADVGACNDPAHLVCAMCGHDWIEEDVGEIAAAWFGFSAFLLTGGREPSRTEKAEAERFARQRRLYAADMAAKKARRSA